MIGWLILAGWLVTGFLASRLILRSAVSADGYLDGAVVFLAAFIALAGPAGLAGAVAVAVFDGYFDRPAAGPGRFISALELWAKK